MATDILVLNTAVLDLRSGDFAFADALVGRGGLAKCRTADMPLYTQEQIRRWIDSGLATAGGPGNAAPLIARAGLRVAVGVNLGRGNYGGLDIQGRTLFDIMRACGVDMSAAVIHPHLPTGTTFIHESGDDERGGIAYFPNANNDFDFEHFRHAVARLEPAVVYYMYSGLSERGDANGGADLAEFMRWCRARGCITVADSHTLTADPRALIRRGAAVPAYTLLQPLLPELDIFFTSSDEARLIVNTLERPRKWSADAEADSAAALAVIAAAMQPGAGRARLTGVTFARGAFAAQISPAGQVAPTLRVQSRYMAGEVVDLVGAGDSFRAGLLSYVARHVADFKAGRSDVGAAVQMGNLFASLFIKAPLNDRYGAMVPFERLLDVVRGGREYGTLDELKRALNGVEA